MKWKIKMFHDIYDGDIDPYGESTDEEISLKFLTIAHETKNAWLITFEIDLDMKPVQHWLPKSQCAISSICKRIFVPEWLVAEKELEKYEEN